MITLLVVIIAMLCVVIAVEWCVISVLKQELVRQRSKCYVAHAEIDVLRRVNTGLELELTKDERREGQETPTPTTN